MVETSFAPNIIFFRCFAVASFLKHCISVFLAEKKLEYRSRKPCSTKGLSFFVIGVIVQGSAQLPFPGCENVAGKLRQTWQATAGTQFSKPGNGNLAEPCNSLEHHTSMQDQYCLITNNYEFLILYLQLPSILLYLVEREHGLDQQAPKVFLQRR